MRTLNLVERHDKNVWRVELFDDGSIVITSFKKRGINISHSLRYWMKVQNVPKYVAKMFREMVESHPEICRVQYRSINHG